MKQKFSLLKVSPSSLAKHFNGGSVLDTSISHFVSFKF